MKEKSKGYGCISCNVMVVVKGSVGFESVQFSGS